MSEAARDGVAAGPAAEQLAPVDPRLRENSCFGCGDHNPIGMHLRFERSGEGVEARYRPRPEDQGFPGFVHGGLLGLLLDEAMAWAMYADDVYAVTARMETRFRRPASLEGDLIVSARILRSRGRRIEVEGELRQERGDDAGPRARGTAIAQSLGLFVRMSEAEEPPALASLRARLREGS